MKKPVTKNILSGIPAAPGIAIGKAYLYQKDKEYVEKEAIENTDAAVESLKEALEKSKKELKKIFGLAVDKMGDKRAGIFEAQMMILDDPVLIKNIVDRIQTEKLSPEYIVNDEISKYQKIMSKSSEPYMKERSHDIEDIKNRIIRNLRKKKWVSRIESDVIVVTDVITPADTVLFTRVNVKGYVTNFGGLTSHAAIVARSLNIPAVVGVRDATENIKNGDILILDGIHGKVIINPDEDQLAEYKKRIEKLNELDTQLAKLKNEPAVTIDGKKILLQSNLDLIEELDFVVEHGSEGIGLVRTEQIFDVTNSFPDEEEQYEMYSKIAQKLYPEFVVFRTFDVGGDKYLPVDIKEPNPFLGWRGIRFLLDNINLLKTQLRAMLRASAFKNVKIMLPMISSIEEVRKTKEILDECKTGLEREGKQFDQNIELGIMIEVPSAAVLSKEFSDEVDFFSIGTNDLIQYILAVDRGNENVSEQYQEFHPAVVKALDYIIKEGKKGNISVSICGEMAADLLAVPLLIGLGLDALSVSASTLPRIKKTIRSIKFEDAKRLANQCLSLKTEKEIKEKVYAFYKTHFTDEIENLLEE